MRGSPEPTRAPFAASRPRPLPRAPVDAAPVICMSERLSGPLLGVSGWHCGIFHVFYVFILALRLYDLLQLHIRNSFTCFFFQTRNLETKKTRYFKCRSETQHALPINTGGGSSNTPGKNSSTALRRPQVKDDVSSKPTAGSKRQRETPSVLPEFCAFETGEKN